jgi:hypothetical protein
MPKPITAILLAIHRIRCKLFGHDWINKGFLPLPDPLPRGYAYCVWECVWCKCTCEDVGRAQYRSGLVNPVYYLRCDAAISNLLPKSFLLAIPAALLIASFDAMHGCRDLLDLAAITSITIVTLTEVVLLDEIGVLGNS